MFGAIFGVEVLVPVRDLRLCCFLRCWGGTFVLVLWKIGLYEAAAFDEWAYAWMTTTVGDILPVEMPKPEYAIGPLVEIRIAKNDHPLTASLPWSSIGEHGYMLELLVGTSSNSVTSRGATMRSIPPGAGAQAWPNTGQTGRDALQVVCPVNQSPDMQSPDIQDKDTPST